eukprot:12394860-Heterocapsa_arctica.AAC.1
MRTRARTSRGVSGEQSRLDTPDRALSRGPAGKDLHWARRKEKAGPAQDPSRCWTKAQTRMSSMDHR